MDFKPMFPSLNVLWTRWSAYQIKPHQWGGEYLLPAEGATDLTYNCAEQPGPLVADALELGQQLHMGAPDKNRLCAAFAARYGLLGLNAEKGEGATEDPNVPPCYRPLNSWEYGEDVSFFQSSFVMLYQHLSCVSGTKHRCICGLRSSMWTTAEKMFASPTSVLKKSSARSK